MTKPKQPRTDRKAPSVAQDERTSGGTATESSNGNGRLRLEWRSPSELAENPRNWRTHPESQQAALVGVLSEVGWAGACLYNERTGRLIDGHLRRKVAQLQGAETVPVLVGDWSEADEAKILATLDPIAGLAECDPVLLRSVLDDVQTATQEVADLLTRLWEDNKPVDGAGDGNAGDAETPFDEFDPQAVTDDCVPFKFGDYSGQVQKLVYDSFVAEYKRQQVDSNEPMLTDVLRAWLNV